MGRLGHKYNVIRLFWDFCFALLLVFSFSFFSHLRVKFKIFEIRGNDSGRKGIKSVTPQMKVYDFQILLNSARSVPTTGCIQTWGFYCFNDFVSKTLSWNSETKQDGVY